jgi:hypothetical protein
MRAKAQEKAFENNHALIELFRVSVQARLIRKDEEFAINSIANAHSGTSRPGENLPDPYHSWRATPCRG